MGSTGLELDPEVRPGEVSGGQPWSGEAQPWLILLPIILQAMATDSTELLASCVF